MLSAKATWKLHAALSTALTPPCAGSGAAMGDLARLFYKMTVFRLSLGLWLMIQGAAGYERYMHEGRTVAACFDAGVQIAGFALFWIAATDIYAAILRALEAEGRADG